MVGGGASTPREGACPTRTSGVGEGRTTQQEAAELFTEGVDTGETAVKYVPLTVLFALVLFLIAAGQRCRQQPVRISANALAVCLLVYTLVYLIILPRL